EVDVADVLERLEVEEAGDPAARAEDALGEALLDHVAGGEGDALVGGLIAAVVAGAVGEAAAPHREAGVPGEVGGEAEVHRRIDDVDGAVGDAGDDKGREGGEADAAAAEEREVLVAQLE